MELIDALGLLAAPGPLLAWVEEAPDEQEAWDGCDRAEWLVWMGGGASLPVEALLDASCSAVAASLAQLEGPGLGRLTEALGALRRGEASADAARLAASVGGAGAEAPQSYRSARVRGHAHAASADRARAAEQLADHLHETLSPLWNHLRGVEDH